MLAFLGILSFFVSIGGLITGGLWAWKKKPKAKKLLITSAIVCVASLLLIGITAEKPEETTPEDTRTKTTPSPSTTLETTPQASETPATTETGIAETGTNITALTALEELAVKGRAPKTGYDRDNFGTAWSDVDHNGCDTRNDILTRDLTNITYKAGTNNCVVASGTLNDPYTGKTINFVRGQDTSTAVQIDHVVALSDAWQKGAQAWDEATRTQFANDPLNLIAVDGSANQQKSDSDTASWLPSNKGFRCAYVARQVAVKKTYTLWVTDAEKEAMRKVLTTCPNEPLPQGVKPEITTTLAPTTEVTQAPATTPVQTTQPPAPAPEVTQAPTVIEPTQPPTTNTGTDPDFGTCKEAKKHGNTPYVKGVNPEYDYYRDADGDGVVCE